MWCLRPIAALAARTIGVRYGGAPAGTPRAAAERRRQRFRIAASRQAALLGAQNRDGWGAGLTILTALANLLPALPDGEAYLALFHGARQVASDCDGQPSRREHTPLESRPEPATLKRWLRRWTRVRHREAAERTLLTGIAAGLSPAALAYALLAAETERAFADGGHSLDFINKAFECLDLIGWEHASSVLPTVVVQMAESRGAEESTEWRQPDDLIALCKKRPANCRNCSPKVLALAAHSPVERAALQTADIARRLMRGGELHQARPS